MLSIHLREPFMRTFALMLAFVSINVCAQGQSGPDWQYTGNHGPLTWVKLDPSSQACSKAHEQSPIDIRGARLNKALQPIEFHYIGAAVTLENTGRSIIVHVNPGSYMIANGV